MEIKLSGKDALVIMGVTVMEAAIAWTALNKAAKAEKKAAEKAFEASVHEFNDFMKGLRIKELEKENARLKSRCKVKES